MLRLNYLFRQCLPLPSPFAIVIHEFFFTKVDYFYPNFTKMGQFKNKLYMYIFSSSNVYVPFIYYLNMI